MKTVWKFPLETVSAQTVKIPLPAKVLTVQPQGDGVCLWAEVSPELEKVKVDILIAGTGHELPDKPMRYINTFQLLNGTLVFHAYEMLQE
jgi:hypothetical protein